MKKKLGTKRASRMDRKLTKPDRKPKVSHSVTASKSNGSLPVSTEVAPAPVPIGEAMRRAVEALGPVVIDQDKAVEQLRELADCHDHVTREQAAYFQKAEDAKIAKKALESATNLLLEKVRAFTHATPLPLFDHPQSDADHQRMIDGIEAAVHAGDGAVA